MFWTETAYTDRHSASLRRNQYSSFQLEAANGPASQSLTSNRRRQEEFSSAAIFFGFYLYKNLTHIGLYAKICNQSRTVLTLFDFAQEFLKLCPWDFYPKPVPGRITTQLNIAVPRSAWQPRTTNRQAYKQANIGINN